MTNLKLGIRPKLLLSFALMLVTTFLAAAIAFISYDRFSQSMGQITEVSVPLMANSMELAQQGVEFNASLPLLAAASTQQERIEQVQRLEKLAEQTEAQLSVSYGEDASDSSLKKNLADLAQLRLGVKTLDQLVSSRLTAQSNVSESMQGVGVALETINEGLLDIIDNKIFDFLMDSESAYEVNSNLIGEISSKHLRRLLAAMRLQNVMNNSVLAFQADPLWASSDTTRAGVMERIANYRELLLSTGLDDEELLVADIASLQSSLGLSDEASSDGGDAAVSAQVVMSQLTQLQQSLAGLIDDSNRLFLQLSDELVENVTSGLPTFINAEVGSIIALLQLRAELNTLAGILANVPHINSTSLLEPLTERYDDSAYDVEDFLDVVSDVDGMESIKTHVQTLLTIGNVESGVFSHRRNVLAQKKSIDELLTRLDALQAGFVVRLVDQVRSSREQVAVSSESFAQVVSNSRTQLAFVFAVAVLVTVLVYWLFVSRSLLFRLLGTIEALKTLAAGDYNVRVNQAGNDELTDLAKTVEVFRTNAIAARTLSEQQAESQAREQALEKEQARVRLEAAAADRQRHEKQQRDAEQKQAESEALERRVDDLLTAVSAAAQGNLKHPIDTNGNDLAGRMGRALKELFDELSESLQQIDLNASKMSQASEFLSRLSVDMNDAASINSRNAKDTAALSSDLKGHIVSVADASEQMYSAINGISKDTGEAEKVASEAVELARSTDITIRKLSDSSLSIGQVVKVITSIAEQTNLLALNATIEAARAGDAGKGFAVVANEVKELAKETASATEQIQSRIGDIQSDTNSAVSAIESIGSIIQRISQIQSSIALAVDEQATVSLQISTTVSQSASNSEEITKLIHDVSDKTQQTQEASVNVSSSAVELSEMATELKTLVDRFVDDEFANQRFAA